jgi:pyruvate formate lyase activating enzyme
MNRRDFLKLPGAFMAGCALSGLAPRVARAADSDSRFVHKAMYFKKLDGKKVQCQLCPRECEIADQERGWCGNRQNDNGALNTYVYGRPVSINNDPIEKKPFFHVRPGTKSLSISTAGCNFECMWCQNWELSQFRPEQIPARFGYVSPERIVSSAGRAGSKTIAFTYGEPVVFYEYMLDIAKKSKPTDILGVMVSNGYIKPEPMTELLKYLGAVKIDFKAYNHKLYKKWCRGTLDPVLETMKLVKKKGVWLEMVHLTIPTLNDDPDEHKRLCDWILKNLGPDVPLHFTRFHPTYKVKNLPPTPPSTLERAYETARKAGIHYPYVGNLPGHEAENTRCHHCKETVIKRVGFTLLENRIVDGKCQKCGKPIPGLWD